MRELRIQSAGRQIRVFYAFDPRRTAILLLGAHKTHARRFYDNYVPRADLIYDRHLNELARERRARSYKPSTMAHRPWSELTKHWSPERKAANARAEARLRADIRQLQAQARKEGRHPGDPTSAESSSQRPQMPTNSLATTMRSNMTAKVRINGDHITLRGAWVLESWHASTKRAEVWGLRHIPDAVEAATRGYTGGGVFAHLVAMRLVDAGATLVSKVPQMESVPGRVY